MKVTATATRFDIFDYGFTKVYRGFVIQHDILDNVWKVYNAHDVEVGSTNDPANFAPMVDHFMTERSAA